MANTTKEYPGIIAGQASYQQWQKRLYANPEYQRIYEEEATKGELWLQLVEARQAAGLTKKQMAERLGVSQAQVSRIEKQGYDAYTLTTLRRYVKALGEGFTLEVIIHCPSVNRVDEPDVSLSINS